MLLYKDLSKLKDFFLSQITSSYLPCTILCRPVIPWGAGGTTAPPDFGRLFNPILTSRGRLCPPHYY